MQYGFYVNQKAMVEMALDLNYDDIAVFEFVKSYTHSKGVEKLDVDGTPYYWISWKLIVEELPFLGTKSRYGVILHINNLIKAGLLKRYENNGSSGKSFFAFGDRYDEFEGYEKNLNTCQKKSTPPVEKIQQEQYNNISEYKESISKDIPKKVEPKALPANKFYLSSTERDAVLNNPDRIAEIKMQHFVARTKGAAAEVGMDEVTFQNFVNHWCEHSDGSEHIRCEDEQFFDVKKRMKTWMSRSYNKPSSAPPQEKQYSKPHVWTQEELDNLYK